ncbi:MAG: helix-turn-helix transcriptional regulator [Flavonifractor plautii]
MKLNETIRRLRRAKGLTQEQVAQALGVSGPAVNKWERGACCPDLALLAPAGPPAGHRSEHSALLPGGADRCRDRRVYRGALHPGPERGHRCGLSAGGGAAPPVARGATA